MYRIKIESKLYVVLITSITISAITIDNDLTDSSSFLRSLGYQPYEGSAHFLSEDKYSDADTYKTNPVGRDSTTLCWAEYMIITEDNKTKNKKLTKEYSVILESLGSTEKDFLNKNSEISCYVITDKLTGQTKSLNFTTVKKTEEVTVKEHKTLFCGAGPVLSRQYLVWPKLNKRKIEVRISPSKPVTWKIIRQKPTKNYSYTTLDTTTTEQYHVTEEAEEDYQPPGFNAESVVGEAENNPNEYIHDNMQSDEESEEYFSNRSLIKTNNYLVKRNSTYISEDCDILKRPLTDFLARFKSKNRQLLFDMIFINETVSDYFRGLRKRRHYSMNVKVVLEYRETNKNGTFLKKKSSLLKLDEQSIFTISV